MYGVTGGVMGGSTDGRTDPLKGVPYCVDEIFRVYMNADGMDVVLHLSSKIPFFSLSMRILIV